jgi:hypothetical protein
MWLNFVDPNFLGEEISFNNGRGHANIWLRYMLTSFGDVAQAHVVYEQGNTRLHVTGMRYANYEKSFPGLQAEALEMPLRVGSASFAVSPRASISDITRTHGNRLRIMDRTGIPSSIPS